MKYEKPIMNISMFKAEQIKAEQGGVGTVTGGDPLYSSNINAAIDYANNNTLANVVGANANKALVVIRFSE